VEKINLAHEAAQLTEFWSQRVLASGNGNLFKVAKGIGSTNWHSHDDQDEVFLVLEGHITIQMRDRNVDLGPGELFVIPRGTEHCPLAQEEARFLLIGPEVTSNAAGGKPDWSYTSTQRLADRICPVSVIRWLSGQILSDLAGGYRDDRD
jgi:mannose-6-phosphate isomerase-like protein (cupin superfamily)